MVSAQILIAEDNSAMSTVLQFNLEQAGFDVQVAEDGAIAWELAREGEFDLFITDQQMPNLDGTEFCRRLRSLLRYQTTPVIMLTAKGLELDLGRIASEIGVTAVLSKPFSPREVIQLVTDQLAQAKAIEPV